MLPHQGQAHYILYIILTVETENTALLFLPASLPIAKEHVMNVSTGIPFFQRK